MSMGENVTSTIYTPDNEPYIGRELLFHLDQVISSSLEQYDSLGSNVKGEDLTAIQIMALQQSSQFLNILCSLRELIRQGYLFGAHVLVRPLIERQTILLYLHLFPERMASWENGWHQGDAPGLARMIDDIQSRWNRDELVKGKDILKKMNSLLHAKPDSVWMNLVHHHDDKFSFSPSKILNRPQLCDDLCADVIPSVVTVQIMLNAYFPSCSIERDDP